jgi:hypothetical protein
VSFGEGLFDAASGCVAGALGAEEEAEPAQPLIALLPGGDFIGETGTPILGCSIDAYSEATYDVNIVNPSG